MYIPLFTHTHTHTHTADFGSNRFDHVPLEVCDFKELVKLSFYRNLLRSVPEELKHLENLKDLNLRCVCVCVCTLCVCVHVCELVCSGL